MLEQPWASRIIETADVAPHELTPHPHNFRIHPDGQAAALAGVLDEIGLIGHVLVNRTTGHILDGHLRRELAIERHQATVPVAYVDLTPAEEALALATYDAIGALATTDAAQLDALLADVQTGNAAIDRLLDDLRTASGLDAPLPTPAGQRSPTLLGECLIEIHCSRADLGAFQVTLDAWSTRESVTLYIS